MSKPIKLFRHPLSGHAHRVELFLSLLNVPTELVFVDLAKGAHKSAEFLAMNPFGQVPVIDDNGVVLSDSNAILVYLAKQYDSQRPVAAQGRPDGSSGTAMAVGRRRTDRLGPGHRAPDHGVWRAL